MAYGSVFQLIRLRFERQNLGTVASDFSFREFHRYIYFYSMHSTATNTASMQQPTNSQTSISRHTFIGHTAIEPKQGNRHLPARMLLLALTLLSLLLFR